MSNDWNFNENEEESDLDLGIEFEEENDSYFVEEKQRTEKWRIDRLGLLTGSKGKTIMGCNRRGSKLSWADKEKIFEISESIAPYIYTCAMERITGNYIEGAASMQMKYGTAIEPLISRRVQEQYLNDLNLTAKEVEFKVFKDIPTAGASSDRVTENQKGNVTATVEFKACCSWETHYKRTYEKTDESSMDFWQMIIQMIAWDVNKAYYVVATPPKDIKKYVFAENPMDYYEDWCEETEISFEEVVISPIHIEALKQRIVIIENVINKYIATKKPIKSLLEEEINFHKKRYLEQVIPMEQIESIDELTAIEVETLSGFEEEEKIEASEPQEELDFDNEFF